MAKKPS